MVDSEKKSRKAGHKASAQPAADERDRTADERDRTADERDRTADERDRTADERERTADERDRTADERERKADERERKLGERELRNGVDPEIMDQRALESIDRARDLLAMSGKQLSRQEARVGRERARRGREQGEIDREAADGARGLAALDRDPEKALERSEVLRQQARAVIGKFAANEDRIARLHEELAARNPDRREEHRRIAEKARDGARRAREALRTFTERV